MITWLNENQGFVMSLLTLVYVIATGLILRSNKKSADAAITANKQQYALELLNRRFTSYYCLNDWVSIAKSLFIQDFQLGTPLDAFNAMLYNNAKIETLENINTQLKSIELCLEQSNIPAQEQEQLRSIRAQQLQDRFFKRFAMLDAEHGLINQIEILFPKIDFEPIRQFSDSFTKAVIDSSLENIEQLKKDAQIILDKNIRESLWEVLKEI